MSRYIFEGYRLKKKYSGLVAFVGCVILKTFRFVKCEMQRLTGCMHARLQEFQVLDPVFTIVLMHVNVAFCTVVFLSLRDLCNNNQNNSKQR